jgi:hypothetical protein
MEAQIRRDVEKILAEQFQLFCQQQLQTAREGSADMANALRRQSQCPDASAPYVEHDPQTIEGRIKTHMQKLFEHDAQQIKRSMEQRATSIAQEALQKLEAKLAEQLLLNNESLKASFEEHFHARQQHLPQGTLDALRKQMEADFNAALEFMRSSFCEEVAVFKQKVHSDFRALGCNLESGFASLRAEVGEVIKQEILHMKKVIHEEFAALRQENQRDLSAIKQEFVTLRWEHQRDFSAFKEKLTAMQDEFATLRTELRTMSELHHREAVANHAKFDQLINLISKIQASLQRKH